jgi:hypothetical protein
MSRVRTAVVECPIPPKPYTANFIAIRRYGATRSTDMVGPGVSMLEPQSAATGTSIVSRYTRIDINIRSESAAAGFSSKTYRKTKTQR